MSETYMNLVCNCNQVWLMVGPIPPCPVHPNYQDQPRCVPCPCCGNHKYVTSTTTSTFTFEGVNDNPYLDPEYVETLGLKYE